MNLFDFQINGFAGVDFQRDDLTPERLRFAVGKLRQHGAARIFITLITDDVDKLCRRFERLEKMRVADPDVAAMVAGYHLEGPWLSQEIGYRGAHPPEPMHAPDWAEYESLQAATGGRIRLVTLAPEWPGSANFIGRLAAGGIHVSLGHTNASLADIDAAIAAGARFCTHLGNAMPQLVHRHDNIIQRLLSRDELTACLIADGIHIPPFMMKNIWRTKPPGKVLFTTDAITGAAAGPGRYTLGPVEIVVDTSGFAHNPRSGGGGAGSTLAPDEGVRNVAKFLGLSLAESERLWSIEAARAFGVTLPLPGNTSKE